MIQSHSILVLGGGRMCHWESIRYETRLRLGRGQVSQSGKRRRGKEAPGNKWGTSCPSFILLPPVFLPHAVVSPAPQASELKI